MALVRCPTCSQKFDPSDSPAMPFCSVRCRRIDLGRWMSEDISIPFREVPEDPDCGDEEEA
ncbi:MAG: DNA gyrase inhibitor YacG [Planctomycetota bacterium]|nr:MAG: DNA gyrase inhibitor YacG [Planctomycetota bacterium]